MTNACDGNLDPSLRFAIRRNRRRTLAFALCSRSGTATWMGTRTRSSSVCPSRSEGKRASRKRMAGTLVSKCLRAPGSAHRQEDGGGAWTARDGIEAAMLHKTHMPVSDRCVCPPHSPRARSDVGCSPSAPRKNGSRHVCSHGCEVVSV